MKTELEIRNKIDSMMNMLSNVRKDNSETARQLETGLEYQIDMLLWIIGDRSGLPPLDEEEIYACYREEKD